LATKKNSHIRPCDIEFYLPRPSYTIHTLVYIREKYPEHQFSILMGEDNLQTLHRWQNYEYIVENFPIFVYPRFMNEKPFADNPLANQVHYLKEVPLLYLSASFIRACVAEKKSIQYLVPEEVAVYIDKMGFYQKK
jgi:nicotinate-nucleotide adenylyltransferase